MLRPTDRPIASAEEDLARAIADFRQLHLISRADFPQERLAIPGINRRFLSRHSVLPLEIANDALVVAMADPDDDEAKAGLAFASSLAIMPCVATFADIDDALATGEAVGDDLSAFGDELAGGAADDIARLLEDDSEAPVIRLVQRVLANAVNRRASDIHIEPMARHLSVRYRIDGRLQSLKAEKQSHMWALMLAAMDIYTSPHHLQAPARMMLSMPHQIQTLDALNSPWP